MLEDNQIQSWSQLNLQIQQNNFAQNQQPVLQNIIETNNQNLWPNIKKQVQNIYYHPSRLTKILSGIYRFMWIFLIRAGLCNFSLIWTENLSFFKILYVWGVITLCWILYILLWRLLYSTKNKVHLWISLLLALIVNIIFSYILRKFTTIYQYWIDGDSFELLSIAIIIFNLIYFSISTIRWIIKCRKFKKKWVINPKYLNSTPSKKKVWVIVTIVLISLIIINLIYGKIQWSKIPEIDASIFVREEHQNKLPDEEDALIQLGAFYDWNNRKAIDILDSYYLYEFSTTNSHPENANISWKQHTNECIVINSWWNEYCGTWVWNKRTLNRTLNNYYYVGNNGYYTKDFIDSDWYLSIDWEKATIFEYIHKSEQEIREIFKELDRITSLNYYLPNDRTSITGLIPPYFQWFSRASMVVLQYYIFQKDRDMVTFIIKLNYKIIDICNNSWSLISQLIWMVIQGIVDSNVNSYIQLFPKNIREELSERYKTQIYDKDEIIDKMVKWEFVTRNRAKGGIMWDVWKNTPSLYQFLFHFPFYSEKEINRLMIYSYYEFWNWLKDNSKKSFLGDTMKNSLSLYNIFW